MARERDSLGRLPASTWNLPAAALLARTDFARGYYEPAARESFDARVGVAFQPFRWDEGDDWTWLFTTVGLSALEQKARPAVIGKRVANASPHLELCAAFREPSVAGWKDFRRSWEAGTLADFGAEPPILDCFFRMAHDFASWIQDGDVFAIGDHVENASLAAAFPSSLLVPPCPQLFTSGLVPFDAAGTPAPIPIGSWLDRDALHTAGDHIFVQVAPLTKEEYEVARWGGFRFFLDALLATDAEQDKGMDAADPLLDLQRPPRHGLARRPAP